VSEREHLLPDDDALASEPPLDEATEQALAEALRSAWAPAAIAPERHAELLELALVDPFAPPSAEEARESERLRRALETGDDRHEDVRLLRALSAANEPGRLAAAAGTARAELARSPRRGTSNVVFVSFGAAVLAAAAAFVVFLGNAERAAPSAARQLAASRSTAELFEREFEQGGATERIDRIASARAHDLRENRYAMWGAR